MRNVVLATVVALSGWACSHPQNPERKDSLTEQVTGSLQPTNRAFLKGDPVGQVACSGDAQCPKGSLCLPEKRVCFTPEMDMTKLVGACPLVPLYFAFDSTALVPEAERWVAYDADCLKERGAKSVVLEGHADVRGDAAYNQDLSQRRAAVVKDALGERGVTIDVAVRGEGTSDPVLKGTTEHDYAYNRRVELKSK